MNTIINYEKRTIRDFPNYTIDTTGNVLNKHGKAIQPEVTNNGYLRVSLSNDKIKHKHLSVHRVVAETFVPNPNDLPQVNHINENKRDNSVSNLEWCSPVDNLNHSHVIDKASKAKEHKIKCVTTNTTYNSIKEAASELNLHHSNIVACCMGRRKKCGGLEWEYELNE